MRNRGCWHVLFLLVLVAMPSLGLAVPAGTVISNTAQATFSTVSRGPDVASSNRIDITTVVARTPSSLMMYQYAPGFPGAQSLPISATQYETNVSGVFASMPPPVPLGAAGPIDLATPVPLVETTIFHQGEPLFLSLFDADQNLNPVAAEIIEVTLTIAGTGELEVLRFVETGTDTGVFTGYILTGDPSPTAYDGMLSAVPGPPVVGNYIDAVDNTDTSEYEVLVDPFGIVFDSNTGSPVDGATITLIDDDTGDPALVYGDDGISSFPSSIISGGTVTDSGGRVYNFSTGAYRFPFMVPGNYRLQVDSPSGYRAPSAASTAAIQALPGAPFAILEPGSRGEAFVLNPGPAIHIDIPLDPDNDGLYVQKTASKPIVASGDFLSYEITVNNASALPAEDVVLADRLPPGFRYQHGSVRVDGQVSREPEISSDGRSLGFALGQLAAQATARVRYVVEVAAGAHPGKASNEVSASDRDGNTSNRATATVEVQEDLFRSRNILMGRIYTVETCEDAIRRDGEGIGDIRIYLENGTYVVSDEQGMFHFEGIQPGVHVVQLDLDTLPEQYEIQVCEDHSRFAGRSFSRFVDLHPGTMWRTDFHVALKPRLQGTLDLDLAGNLNDRTIDYALAFEGKTVALDKLRATLLLPEGVSYKAGSSRVEGNKVADPEVMGNSLTYRIGAVPEDFSGRLTFEAQTDGADAGIELLTRALLTFDTPAVKNQRTPVVEHVLAHVVAAEKADVAQLTVRPHFAAFSADLGTDDKAMLDRHAMQIRDLEVQHVYVTGHTDDRGIKSRSRHIHADNQALSMARARNVGRYLSDALGLPPAQITVFGKGADEPLVDGKDEASRALNRRVDVHVVAAHKTTAAAFTTSQARNSTVSTKTEGQRPGEQSPTQPVPAVDPGKQGMPAFDNAWMEAASGDVEWLWPTTEHSPPIPVVKIAVKHSPNNKLTLLLEGKPVAALNYDGTSRNKAGTVAVSRWTGVDLGDGDNHFEVIVRDRAGNEIRRLEHMVHYSGPPAHAELVPSLSYLVADGKNSPVIAVRMRDQDGFLVHEGVVGQLGVNAPYLLQVRADALDRDPLNFQPRKLQFIVARDGIAYIKLQPTSRTGEAVLNLELVNGPQDVRAWLEPQERDWILVGLAEGTVGHNNVSGNMENLSAADIDENIYQDGRVAFFAKGQVRGEWLLTISYDTARNRGEVDDSLFDTINPDTYYTLYGDGTNQDYDAASDSNLYLKIEREKFYALFGDYTTGLTVTELSRYDRSFNGFKSELRTDKYAFSAFASDTDQGFVKDEIRGDGTSGLYQLSQSNIIINSDKIVIETRDRFRSEIILSQRTLYRYLDYNIDYAAGTLFFKQPVPSKDENLDPVFIVVDYESNGTVDETMHYGGRGSIRMLANKLEVGASHIYEGRGEQEGRLSGFDATLKLGDYTELRGEIATSRSEQSGSDRDGNAYIAELTHRIGKADARVYLRRQDEGFGLGQQNGSENGTRKQGVELQYRHDERISLNGLAYRQETLATGAERDVAEARLQFKDKRNGAHVGILQATDSFDNGTDNDSRQLLAGVQRRFLDNRINLRLNHEQSLGGDDDSSDFPTRTVLGADYTVNDKVSLFAEQEFTRSSAEDTEGTRAGIKATPWNGGELATSMEQRFTELGARVFANLGLNQAVQLDDHWRLDFGLDRSHTLKHPGSTPVNVNVPPASGGADDFTAVSAGVGYRHDDWSWTSRVELRDADSENKWGATTSILGEPRKGLGVSARAQYLDTDPAAGDATRQADIQFGIAHRPVDGRWIVLDRLNLGCNDKDGADADFRERKIVNNLHANYRMNSKTQLAIQYGAKYVRDTIDGQRYSGFTDLLGLEGRYDISQHWDVGAHASVMNSHDADQKDYSYGLSLGYNLMENMWLGIGYNLAGFRDDDFSQGTYRARGPYFRLRMKFDQQSAKALLSSFKP